MGEIQSILNSNFPKEELRRCVLKRKWEKELSDRQIKLLEELSCAESLQPILAKIKKLNKNKSIKEKILEVFPGFYGRFFLVHFSQFLEDSIITDNQEKAYKIIIRFLDEAPPLQIPEEIIKKLDEAMGFWTDERLMEAEKKKHQSIENPEIFLQEESQALQEYMDFKDSEKYQDSSLQKIMTAMKRFSESSGYNEVFIPALRRLSASYENYYQKMLKASELLTEKQVKAINKN